MQARLWLKTRSLLREVPRTSETAELGARACIQVLSHGLTEGLPHEEAAELFEEGKELARLAGDSAQHAFLVYRYGIFRGMHEGAIQDWVSLSTEALHLAEAAGDGAVKFYVQMGLAMGLLAAGRLRDGLTICNQALARTDDPHFAAHLTGRSPYIYLLLQRSFARRLMGQRESEGDLDSAVALAREHGYLGDLVFTLTQRLSIAVLVGASATAASDAAELTRLAEQLGSPIARGMAKAGPVIACLLRGNSEEAAQLIDDLAKDLREFADFSPLRASDYLVHVSGLLLMAGRADEARSIAEQAVRSARQIGARTRECEAQIALAAALRHTRGTGPAAESREAIARARELVDETEARIFLPFIIEDEARLLQLEGGQAAFEEKLLEAHRLFTEMGATGHAERVANELRLL